MFGPAYDEAVADIEEPVQHFRRQLEFRLDEELRSVDRLLAEARAQARTDHATVDASPGLGYAGADKPGAAAAPAPGND